MAAITPRQKESERLYEQYGKPLEAEHAGEYVAVSRQGETLMAVSLLEALQQGRETFGPGNFIFKIGERAVGKWR